MKLGTQRSLLCTTALIGFLVIPAHAYAEPQGGFVTGGSAGIQQSGTATTINQSSDRAIIRWDSFDLNSSESVRFVQPRTSSITVNRIRDNKPSQIDGRISANGNIVLMNPNGVVFGATSTVDVGGLVATTSDLEDDNAFLGGGAVKFTKPGNPNAKIINNGSMTVREGGLVGLVAPNVENHGVIEARLGKAILASGDIATIDFAGDGLIKLQVSDGVLSQAVLNTGTIKADGGSIILTAAQARGMVDALITNTGTLQANTVKVGNVERRGEILISTKGIDLNLQMPRAEGIVFNTGTIEAKGAVDDLSGGLITILGDTITIGDGSFVTASGGADGGTIKIGGEYQGGNGLPTSDKVYILEHAILNAESRKRGKGGTIILWSDDHTTFLGHADVSGGVEGGDGGFIEVSGKNTLAFTGTVDLTSVNGKRGTLLLDPTDIVISNGGNQNISGSSPFTPSIDNGPTVLNISTLLSALASGDVIVQTRATGAQTGNITVSNAIAWSSGSTLTLDAHNNIIVNAAITGNNLRFVVGNDLQLNAAISGAGSLTIQQAADSTTVGIGASAVGTLNLSTTDLSYMVGGGWSDIIIGKLTATAAMDIRTTTWSSNLTLRSGSGTISVNTGSVNVGSNNLSIVTNGDIAINSGASLTGTGNLSISQSSAATTVGLAGGAGTINLTATEIGRITNGWANITVGRTDGSGQINMGAVTWNDFLTVQSGSGLINVTGVQTMGANNLTFVTDGDITLGATNVLFGSGTLTFRQSSAGTTIGLGDGQTGAINLTTLEVARIRDGWSNIVFGRTDGAGDINVGALTWTDALTLQTGTGVININGTQTMAANALTLRSDADFNLAGNLTGTGTLTFAQSSASTSIAIGTGQTGTLHFSNADMARLTDGWTMVVFGRNDGSSNLNVGAFTFVDGLTLLTGAGNININGIISVSGGSVMTTAGGAINVSNAVTTTGVTNWNSGAGVMTIGAAVNTGSTTTFTTSTANLNVNAAVTATGGVLSFATGDGSLAINGNVSTTANSINMTAGAGNITINNAVSSGNAITISSTSGSVSNTGTISSVTGAVAITTDTGALTVGNTLSTNGATTLTTGNGQLTINANVGVGAGSLTLRTNSNVFINADLSGTGAFALVQNGTGISMGLGSSETGDVHLDDTEMDHILNGWSSRTFGRVDSTAALNVASANWVDPLLLRTGSGILTIGGATMSTNNLTLQTDSDVVINGNLTGSGVISIVASTASTSIAVGDTQTGSLHVSNAEFSRIVNGWTDIVIGSTTHTGTLNIGALTWNDRVNLRTGSGILSINGVQNFGSQTVNISTNADIAINAQLSGTGALALSSSSNAATFGVGTGQGGMINLTDAEISLIADTFSSVTLGSTAQTAAITIGASTWKDPLVVRTTGVITTNGVINMGANNLTFVTGSDIVIGAALNGTGSLSFAGSATSTTMGVGTGQAGSVSISDAELSLISNTFTNVIFGGTTMDVALNVAGRSWDYNTEFRTRNGAINFNGVQNAGTKNITIRTGSNLTFTQNMVGSGTLTIMGIATTTTMGIGDGQTGTLNLTNAELAYIVDGWSNLIFGRTDGTATINVGARTWNDSVDFRTLGSININGAQNMGANNLIIRTNANPLIGAALNGTGELSFRILSGNTSVGIGDAMTGTVNFTDAELNFISNGWNLISFYGGGSGVFNVGARTWNDNVYFSNSTGLMSLAAQTMGANNLTIRTGSSLAINGNLSGTGTLTIDQSATNLSLGIGTASGGTVNISDAEFARIVNGWGNIVFGRTDSTSALTAAALTWNDNATLQTGSGALTINGATMGANNLTLITNSNLAIGGNLSGTGNLVMRTVSGATTIGVGDGQAGTFSLLNSELARLVDGWSSVTIGDASITGNMSIGAYTWVNPMTFVTSGNITINGDQVSTETTGTSLVYATINGAFINNAGPDALNPGGGRYLVYSVDENNDMLDGITRPGILTNKTYSGYGPGSVVEAGSQHIYSGIVNKILYLTIDDIDKVYGDNLPAFTYTYVSGLVNGDILGDIIASYSMNALGASVFDDAGVTRVVTGTFNLNNGYSAVVTNGLMTVVKADLIVDADPTTRVYGDANPTFSLSYTGFKNGEDETDLDVLANAATSATILSDVGTYTIITSGGSDNNYNYIYQTGTLTISKATLIATMQNTSRVYGDASPTFTANYTGFKNGQNAGVIDTLAVGSSAGPTANVGTYAITGSGAFDNNYTFSYVNGTMTVNKATLTATANNVSRAYGDANPALGVTYTGFKNGETAAVIDSAVTASTLADVNSDAGTYTINTSGGLDNNYTFAYANGTLTVNKAVVTATVGNGTREYGDANPAFSVTYAGFKNGQNSSVIDTLATSSSIANATSNVGTYATTATGAFDNNYTFSYVDGTLTVTKATLTATANNASRVYGDANPALSVTYTGFKNGETVSVIDTLATPSSAANLLSNVGSYAITATGAVDNNYNFTYVDGTLTVNKALLTATAGNASRAYGDANPVIGVTYTGFKNGQNSSVIDTQASTSSIANNLSNVGTYATTASGAADNNYDFTYVDGVLTINKAALVATAGNVSREYGDANPVIGISYTGFKNGEDSSVIGTLATASSAANATSNVGTYATIASGAFDDNYSFSYTNGTLMVTKAMLTATAASVSRSYGDANPAIGVTYTGFKNGENSSVIGTLATGASAANLLSDVGTYTTTASGAVDNNYDFTYVNGTLSVGKAILTATAGNVSRVYGDANPAIAVTYTGFKNGQNASVIDTQASASSLADNLSNVGTYTTTASGAADNNYDFTYVDGVLTVNKATLLVTADSVSREYGDSNPSIGVTYTGFKNGENDSVIGTLATGSSAANALSNVGSYATTASGAFDDNYTFSYTNGTLTVTKAMLTATADDKTRTYGASAPAYTFTYTGFKNGQNASVINVGAAGSTTATSTSDVGNYAITGSGASDNNYDFTYVAGNLAITKATLTVRADDVSRDQGLANPPLTVTYSGFRNGENSSVINTLATASTTANAGSAIGTYAITAAGAFDNNYTFSYIDGTLTVLDPGYVPPPPAPAPAPVTQLPSTFYASMNAPSLVNQSATQYYMPVMQGQVLVMDPRLENIVIIPEEDNYDYIWQQDRFLIAMTEAVQSYYNLISWQDDRRP